MMLQSQHEIQTQQFDHIFSIEMLEAVGHEGINDFFIKCAQILNKNGTIQVQVITIPDERYDSYRKNCDFIQKYIFPGGYIPSLSDIVDDCQKLNINITDIEILRLHYAHTLTCWYSNVLKNKNILSISTIVIICPFLYRLFFSPFNYYGK